ncbi:stage II sporulation protein M [Thermococcus aggregans]|uniref:Stage II sporulation protein M n=1 Tax=Thermococcus aggregans TaxID=110163 RepID=A0A9E7MYA2_THEAG|nr:stage II sporulation protein M [Thermococcus aggregans]USS41161.1 stage II sporulation protein M [Thermococcus aggregans]
MRTKVFYAFLGVFLTGVLFGVVFSILSPSSAENLFSNLRQFFGGVVEENTDKFGLFAFIFLNNSRVAVICALGGLLFGIVPAGILFFNGFIVGIVIKYFNAQGESLAKILLAIIPHGIIEIPAFAVAGLGGVEWYLELINGEGSLGERFLSGFRKSMKMLALSLIMLLVAAFVEAYVTPVIASVV